MTGGRSDSRPDEGPPSPVAAEVLAATLDLRPRETEVLCALRDGSSNAAIAAQLGISPATVRKHLERAYRQLGVRSRTEAMALLARTASG